ncbi:MAG: hypothetical protein ACLQD8_01230 [Thermoplasmata archaeon]
MNRSVVYLGVGVILTGIALVSFPIAVTGAEVFDIEQEAGLLVAPVGLVVVMLGASFYDPTRTTVGGAFGNPEELRPRSAGPHPAPRAPPLAYHPHDSATCRYCRTYIDYDLANCPRCARSRECRTCGRPLGRVLDRATCPLCARPEALCNCPRLSSPVGAPVGHRPIRGW